MNEFTISGLDELRDSLEKAIKAYPDKAEKTLESCGRKFKNKVVEITDETTKEHTGNLKKGYKVGKVQQYGIDMEVQFYGETKRNPHFHLVENGHEIILKDGTKKGFAPGKHMVQKARMQYQKELPRQLEDACKQILKECDL